MRVGKEQPSQWIRLRAGCLALLFAAVSFAPAVVRAEEEITIALEMRDGVLVPNPLAVPANKKFRLEIRNTGATPAEFESKDLRKEKVIAPGVTSVLVFRPLDPGEYSFFDDFHPDATKDAKMIAK